MKRFKLFQCCIPTKGAKSGIIVDYQRKIIHTVSNQLIDIINEYSNKPIYNLFHDFDNKIILKKFIRYFIENELLIISENIDCYPLLSNEFTKPYLIDTVTIEIDNIDELLINFITNDIDILGVINIRLLLKENIVNTLYEVLYLLENSKIRCLILYVEYSSEIEKELLKVMRKFPRFSEVVFYNFPIKGGNYTKNENFNYNENLLEDILVNNSVESIEDFILNFDVYNESLQYNFMLNKSVHINKRGEIKNFYNDLSIYGRLGTDEFKKVVDTDDFKLIWHITKDKIEICRDCQFRYICPDKRIPYKDNLNDKYYKHKIECKFNPYENSWKV